MNKLRITCLVDNTAKLSSTLWGEHGVSFLIERGETQILFDTGNSGDVLAHNLGELGVDIGGASHVVLSHGHHDHTGGLPWALDNIQHPVVVADPEVFANKYSVRNGRIKLINIPLTQEAVQERAELIITEKPYEVARGIVVSGRVPRSTSYEKGSDRLMTDKDGERIKDIMLDDRSLFVDTEEGLVVVLGCCHAGLVNTLTLAQEMFRKPIRAVLGGTHLNSAGPEQLEKTFRQIQETFQVPVLYLNHCTGPKGYQAFESAMSERVHHCPAGTVLEF